jgi:1-acyl-sn-glycerol-3-phosphate acyltransferase
MFQTIKYTAPWLLQNLIWIPTRFFLYFFSHLRVTGLDNLKKIRGPVIFVSNHTSELDPILLPASLPFLSRFLPIFYVSREKTFYNQKVLLKRLLYGGFFFEAWGAYQAFVGLRDYEESLKNHIKILNAGHSLMIFPEGKKSFDGQIHTSESKGGAKLIVRSCCYVIYVANTNIEEQKVQWLTMGFKIAQNVFEILQRTVSGVWSVGCGNVQKTLRTLGPACKSSTND